MMGNELRAILEYVAVELLIREVFCVDGSGWKKRPPQWLLTGDGMLETIERMVVRGFRCHICSPWEKQSDTWLADFFMGEGRMSESNETFAQTLPEAVQRAAYAALQERT